MDNKNGLVKTAFFNSIFVFGYIVLVAWFFQLAPIFFGNVDKSILAASTMLLLFVFSATITGGLVLGKPILFYLDGAKGDAVKLFFYTVGFLAIDLVFILLALFIASNLSIS